MPTSVENSIYGLKAENGVKDVKNSCHIQLGEGYIKWLDI